VLVQRIKNNLRNDYSGVFLVVRRNHVPGRIACACRAQAFGIGVHIMLPEFPFFDVRKTEFPILFRLVDAFEEAISLLFLGKMKKNKNIVINQTEK